MNLQQFYTKTVMLCALLSFCFATANGQGDTTYFDIDWESTTRSKAVYYRPEPRKIDNRRYEVKDYYVSNNQLQMVVYSFNKTDKQPDSVGRYYYENGNLQEEDYYVNGILQNGHSSYYDNSQKEVECKHLPGNKFEKIYYRKSSGKLWIKEHYDTRAFTLDRVYYYENGKKERIEKWKKGKLKEKHCYTASGNDTAYYEHLYYPRFRGKLATYINDNIRYPKKCRNEQIEGTVEMTLTIDEHGKVTGVETIRRVHPELDAEARRIMCAMPLWEPGRDENYKPVKRNANVYVSFRAIGGGVFFLEPIDYFLYHMVGG